MSIVTDDPNSPVAVGAYELIGGIQASVDRPEDAIKAFEEVAKRQQRPVGAYLALARLHRTTGDLEKASSSLRDATALEPALPGVRAESVRVLLAAGTARESAGGAREAADRVSAVADRPEPARGAAAR